MKEQSRSPLPRRCARATVFPRPNSASLHPWWYSLLHHRSNSAAPTRTRLRLPTHVPWHRLRGLRSYNQGGSLLSHKPDTLHPAPAVCVQWYHSIDHALVGPSKVARQTTFGSMAVVGGGHMPGLGWTLQHHGILVKAPLDSLGGPRRNAPQIRASADPLFEQLDPALSLSPPPPPPPKRTNHWLEN